jgi:5'-3' exonuclease
MSPYLLVDTSYSIFYRYYATHRWYNFAHPEDKFEEDYEWFENEIFKNMFEKKFFDSYSKIIKKWKIPKENIIFLRDCPRKDIWRNQFYDKYKANRDDSHGSVTGKVFKGGPFFKYVYSNILPELEKKFNIKTFIHDCLEADDLIYLTKNHLRELYPNKEIIVVTSDHDLLQLIDDKTTLVTLQNKELNVKSLGSNQLDIEMKVLRGDPSDNIPGCFKKCGPKTVMKLFNDKSLLLEKFKKEPGSLDIYTRNKILVDLSNIPKHFQDSFNGILHNYFSQTIQQQSVDSSSIL